MVVPPPVVVDEGAPAAQVYTDEPPSTISLLSGDVTVGRDSALLGLQLIVEGQRFGASFGYTAAFVPIAGSYEMDTLHLGVGHLTYALVSGPRGRLRAELGLHVAGAPEVTFLAPGAGVSGAVALGGPIGLEARVNGNVWPYTQLDARTGLTFSFGPFGMSVGWRVLYLNDNGALGAANAGDTSDLINGPYALIGLAL